ncbi:MAG TPA: histidine phosphatase family protein [Candidatus Nanoarchaeia archaeon]|nr:histidine phosphatase family protein [Candidatus Nanoarchaeia archaeon]
MELFIVRAGESEGNINGIYQGWTNSPLTEKGKKQAAAAADYLSGKGIDAIFSSDVNRAFESASYLSKRIGKRVQKRKCLREIDFGEFSGKSKASFRNSPYFDERERDRFNFRFPGGESYSDVTKRITRLINRFGNKRCCVYSHLATNRALIGFILGLPREKIVRISQGNGIIYFIKGRKISAINSITKKVVKRGVIYES